MRRDTDYDRFIEGPPYEGEPEPRRVVVRRAVNVEYVTLEQLLKGRTHHERNSGGDSRANATTELDTAENQYE
jgi:hypothetical protein